jgi:hypothetical protein
MRRNTQRARQNVGRVRSMTRPSFDAAFSLSQWTAIFRSNQPDRRRQRSASEGAAGAPMADPPRAPWRGAAARARRPTLSASWRSSPAPMSRSRSHPEREPCARACVAPPSPARGACTESGRRRSLTHRASAWRQLFLASLRAMQRRFSCRYEHPYGLPPIEDAPNMPNPEI